MSLVGQAYDEPGSWGRLSKGWPEVTLNTKEEYDEAWAFVVGNKPRKEVVPYGSYVGLIEHRRSGHPMYGQFDMYSNFVIRLETKEYLELVNQHMTDWRKKHAA